MVKKIVDCIFPVAELPKTIEEQRMLKRYFERIEKERTATKGINPFIFVGLFILFCNFLILIDKAASIGNKILLLIPQGILILEEVHLLFCLKIEKNNLKKIKSKEKFMVFMLISFILATGSYLFLAFANSLWVGDRETTYIIISGQMCYCASYLIGYHRYYKRIVEDLLEESKEEKTILSKTSGINAGIITTSLYLLTFQFHLIPKSFFLLTLCILGTIIILTCGKILVRNRFFCKLYEKELR